MLRSEATADESFAAIFERSKFGMTMVTTIRSSTSEKPFCGLFIVTLPNVNVPFRANKPTGLQVIEEHFMGQFCIGGHASPTEFPKITWNHSKEEGICAVSKVVRSCVLLRNSPGQKNREEAKLPPLCRWLAQELVADRTGNSRRVRNRSASSRRDADSGATWGHKLDQTSLVRAEGTHAGRLNRGRSGVHFESVVDATYRESSGSVEHITALGVRSNAQK